MFDTCLYRNDLTNLVKDSNCYKNRRKPKCICLYLTNNLLSYQNTSSVFVGLTDFHKLVLAVFITTFTKSKANKLSYRDYKHFNHERFENSFKYKLSAFEKLNNENTLIEILNKQTPIKKKLVRTNLASQMTNALRKTIMRRLELESKYFNQKTIKVYKK